jgi:hypothetical protein
MIHGPNAVLEGNRIQLARKLLLFESTKIDIMQKKLVEPRLPEMREYFSGTAAKCRTANLKDKNGKSLNQKIIKIPLKYWQFG